MSENLEEIIFQNEIINISRVNKDNIFNNYNNLIIKIKKKIKGWLKNIIYLKIIKLLKKKKMI